MKHLGIMVSNHTQNPHYNAVTGAFLSKTISL